MESGVSQVKIEQTFYAMVVKGLECSLAVPRVNFLVAKLPSEHGNLELRTWKSGWENLHTQMKMHATLYGRMQQRLLHL
jgi:hypothetical protein